MDGHEWATCKMVRLRADPSIKLSGTTSSGTPDARTPRLKRPRQADANEKLSIAPSCDQGNQRLIDM